MCSPSRPVFLAPSPWRPRSALYSGLKRKCTSVLWRSLDSIQMSPPLPPSPPEGPPRGTNFSRRKATQPLPPLPALTRIVASSMNIAAGRWSFALPCPTKKPRREAEARYPPIFRMAGRGRPALHAYLLHFNRLDHYELAHGALVEELDLAC